jgi:hypothetical protein
MKHQNAKSRKEFIQKMEVVFNEKIQSLPPELQHILLDDLVTAFESRLAVLSKIQHNLLFLPMTTRSVECETI